MELDIPTNGDPSDLQNPFNGGEPTELGNPFAEDFDSTCSTPFVSAPSSPGRGGPAAAGGYFFSAPTSPMHYVLSSALAKAGDPFSAAAGGGDSPSDASLASGGGSFEFDFSARFTLSATCPSSPGAAGMTAADELFLNGQIRPMRLSSHLLRPQAPHAPLLDLSEDAGGGEVDEPESCFRGRDLRLRSGSVHRRARSHSPLRTSPFHWRIEVGGGQETKDLEADPNGKDDISTPPVSASSSRSSSTSSSSSSTGRRSKKWIFLKDLLHRSKSEGRRNPKGHFWHHISPLSSSKEKKASKDDSKPAPPLSAAMVPESEKPRAGKPPAPPTGASPAARGRRRGPAPSAHERHYTANRAQAEEMRRRTFLPYRQGLLGCLGFSSRSYGAINGFARSLNPVSSR